MRERRSAVVDRVVGGIAVLLLEPADEELLVPLARLPAGAGEGDWLEVELEGGELRAARLDPAATARARTRVRAKLDVLRRRGAPGPGGGGGEQSGPEEPGP